MPNKVCPILFLFVTARRARLSAAGNAFIFFNFRLSFLLIIGDKEIVEVKIRLVGITASQRRNRNFCLSQVYIRRKRKYFVFCNGKLSPSASGNIERFNGLINVFAVIYFKTKYGTPPEVSSLSESK